MTELTPPDRQRCQALRPNRTWSPFNLGPAEINPRTGERLGGSRRVDRTWRCNNRAALIVTETQSEDGVLGSMSVCKDCFVELCLQRGGTFTVTEDLRKDKTA
jgi:hypothetical protein